WRERRGARPPPPFLPPLLAKKNPPPPTRKPARRETVADLHLAVLLDADAHEPPLEQQRLALHPDGRDVALADHRVDRHRKRHHAVGGGDLEAREHLGLERALRIGDLGADLDAPGRRL